MSLRTTKRLTRSAWSEWEGGAGSRSRIKLGRGLMTRVRNLGFILNERRSYQELLAWEWHSMTYVLKGNLEVI